MATSVGWRIRTATPTDKEQVLRLWALVFEDDATGDDQWRLNAGEWFADAVTDRGAACFPVSEVGGVVVATAVGTLETGVPNPHCPRGRTVRLANVITLPEYRGKGHGTRLVKAVLEWAESIAADRVDLSATPDGERLYERVGFRHTRAPRMKLVLPRS
jgi:GNAT superfamily N-acetyltransferase